ncbi:MAG: carboxypeptidase regulatory-like domain-containing protein [Terracidiphilus sp.]
MRISLVVAASSALLIAGCSGVPVSNTTQTEGGQGAKLRGKVYGGQQAIVGASVYLYATNITGYGAASLSLLNGSGFVTTGENGSFSISSDYTCPSPSSQVYLYSVGGNAGGGTNSAAGLLAGLGTCSTVAANKPYVVMNEVSTIATAYAIAGFATDATHVSSSSAGLGQSGIANAFAAIQNMEALGTGAALAATPAGNGTVPQSEINTLANILAGCINSTGPGSTACTTLLSNATDTYGTEPTDTAGAAINIAHNPGANVGTLYGLATASAPFEPALQLAPNDFTIAVSYTGGGLNDPAGVAIDASGNAWTANYTGNSLSEFNFMGVAQSGTGFINGGLYDPVQLAIDTSGNVWATNAGDLVLSKFNSGGTPVSASGYTGALDGAYGVAIDGRGYVWAANVNDSSLSEFNSSGIFQTGLGGYTGGGLNAPYGLAIDISNRVWVSNYYDVLSEFNDSGSPISPSGYTGGGLDVSYGVAVDGSGNVWTTDFNDNSLSMFNSNGTAQSGGGFSGGGLDSPAGLAVDGAGNLWAANQGGNSISEFNSSGIAISGQSGHGYGYGAGILSAPSNLAVDGSGNVWVTSSVSGGGSLAEFVGVAAPVVTPIAANLSSPYGAHAVNAPFFNSLALPAPNPATLSSGAVSQAYNGFINATGGTGPFNWTVNGTAVPTNGTLVSIGNGLNVSNTGNRSLMVSGTPTTATPAGSPLSFTAQMEDTATSNIAGPDTYTITIYANAGQISGQINLTNQCNVSTQPNYTVTLTNASTGHTIQTITNTSGQFAFTGLPTGTYNITPSLPSATSSVFYPVSYPGVAVTSSTNLSGENFGAVVGYTVSGTVSYSESQTGQTYLYLQNNNCGGGGNPGTSIPEATLTSTGAFTIRGVAPGNYTANAWMDSTGITSGTDYPGPQGAPNANDPTGSSSSFNVTNANVSNANVTLTNPTYATPPSNPSIQVLPGEGGVLVFYNPPSVSPSNGGSEEAANEYVVEWAIGTGTDSDGPICALGGGTGGLQFGTVAGSHTFYAVGGGATVWILNNTSMGAGSFTAGTAYCFQARSFNTLAGITHPSGWTTPTDSDGNPQGLTVSSGTSFCPSNCTTVSGAVTIPTGVTIAPGAPLYVGLYQQSSSGKGPSAIYAVEIASPVTGANDYSITIPSGSGYVLFGILDQNNDGTIDAGDVTNVRNNNSSGITVSGSTMTGVDVTLPSANSTVQVQTQYSTCATCTPNYSISLQVNESNKVPVAVTLTGTSVSAPYLMMPVDIGLCNNCGNEQFDYYASLPGGTPNVGDSFDFTVTYSDGTQDTGTTVNGAVTAFGSTGSIVGAGDVATNLETTAGTTPNFTWTFPANPSDYTYSFYLSQNNCSGNCTIWQIPGQNSNSSGFTYAQTETGATTGEIFWGTDPTGGGSAPSGSLNSADDYTWQITVQDSNGNQAGSAASDDTP